jgi:alpha-tubulin suppressor-like RCC1 family protein
MTTVFEPSLLPLPGPALSVAGGWYFALILLETGDVYGIGANDHGQLGVGDNYHKDGLVKVIILFFDFKFFSFFLVFNLFFFVCSLTVFF